MPLFTPCILLGSSFSSILCSTFVFEMFCVFIQPGEKWIVDECTQCQCQGGAVSCSVQRCPVEDCKQDEIRATSPGQCCPVCLKREWNRKRNFQNQVFVANIDVVKQVLWQWLGTISTVLILFCCCFKCEWNIKWNLQNQVFVVSIGVVQQMLWQWLGTISTALMSFCCCFKREWNRKWNPQN